MIPRRAVLAGLIAAPAVAQDALPTIRIGVLWDRSGDGASVSGPDQVAAARLAVADFGRLSRGYPVDLIAAGFEKRPDQAVAIARDWFDNQRVAAIVDVPGTAAPVQVQALARLRDRTVMNTGSFNSALTGSACSPTATHWLEDTAAQTMAMTAGLAAEGRKSWFLVAPDDVTGAAFQTGAAAAIQATGGRLLGFAQYPADSASSDQALVNAGRAGADAIGLCASGGALTAQIRAARTLGLFGGKTAVCAYAAAIAEIHTLRDSEAAGLFTVSSFYWNRNERTRAFAARFNTVTGRMPDRPHAATYAAIGHFLRIVESADTTDGNLINIGLRREMPYFFGARLRFRADGRLLPDMGLYRVKPQDAAAAAWDYYELIRIIPALDAFRPVARSRCAPAV